MDILILIEIILFIILMMFSAFFSSSETALFSLDKIQLEQMQQDNHPRIGLIDKLLSRPRKLIINILIGNELVNVSASVLSAAMVISVFGTDSKWINLLIMIPILLLFGEITPKTLAIRNNVVFAGIISRPIEIFSQLIKPIRILVHFISERIITLIVGDERSRGNLITEDMLKMLAREAADDGTLDNEEAHFIEQIFDFGSKTVEEVMTPRSDISFINVEMSVSKTIKKYRKSKHSKMPVYQHRRDSILGFIYIRDLLGVDIKKVSKGKFSLKRFLRQAYFVPETKPAVELFDTFRERQMSIALVVDEYGGVTGLVTMKDLLECIFGDISNQMDLSSEQAVRSLSANYYEVEGSCEISRFNRIMNSQILSKKSDTLAGLILQLHGELPPEGSVLEYSGFRFKVTRVEANRIKLVTVERIESAQQKSDKKKLLKNEKPEKSAGSIDSEKTQSEVNNS